MMDMRMTELFEDSYRLLDSLKEKDKDAGEEIHLSMRGDLMGEYLKVRQLNTENLEEIKKELLQLQESLQMLDM